MKLPFKIDDGKKKRFCTYNDLFIIVEFGLDIEVYTKPGLLFKKKTFPDYLEKLYIVLSIAKEINQSIEGEMIQIYCNGIHYVKCKELHRWANSSLVKMISE